MQGRLDVINATLKDLRTSIFSTGAAIITKGGLITASDIPPGVQAETFGAMCATVMGAAEVAIGEFRAPPPEQLIVQSKESLLVVVSIDVKHSLAVMLKRQVEDAALPGVVSKVGQAATMLKEVL